MKSLTPLKRVPTCLTALALAAAWMSGTANVSAQYITNAQITLRPLTTTEKTTYALPNAQMASGLNTIGVGQPAYLEALITVGIPDDQVTNVTWTLTARPSFSSAALAPSPLGTNVPTYKMADRMNNSGAPYNKVAGGTAGRTMLMPDLEGQYSVQVTIATVKNGTTNRTQNITASSYAGIGTCKLCHAPDAHVALPEFAEWAESPHATMFTRHIDGLDGGYSRSSCITCHTVGYDATASANNNGFDDVAKTNGWTFPTVLTNGNWAKIQSQYPDVANLANIQCENCHGPGNQHVEAAGRTNVAGWPRLSITYAAGNCAQCHDAMTHHYKSAEWNNSKHAVATRTPSGPSRAACARCHTPAGFAAYMETVGTTNKWAGTNVALTAYEAITCATCHDPHDDANPHQLRAGTSVQLDSGLFVADAGAGAICMNCHQSRSGNYTNSLVNYPLGKPTYAGGSSSFGPHDNPAADMLMGVNGYTYGKDIPSSAHRDAVEGLCAGCHMQEAETSPAFTKAGGHTFSMAGNVVTNGVTNTIEMVEVCIKCHGEVEGFNLVKSDYNGDGIIEGVQDEVQKLLDQLSTRMPPSGYKPNANDYKADGKVKTSVSTYTNMPAKFLQAAWNFQLVNNDLSKGIHNSKYAVGLLKASIGDLSGDYNNDGMADWWQQLYFTNITSTLAAPNANPSGDGIPNWLKFYLGLDPRVPGKLVPPAEGGGVVYANGGTLGGGTNTIHIYTAAEISFNTETNKNYQIQAVSTMTGTWTNIGSPIPGTGAAISYLTPTRANVQQYYRVITQ